MPKELEEMNDEEFAGLYDQLKAVPADKWDKNIHHLLLDPSKEARGTLIEDMPDGPERDWTENLPATYFTKLDGTTVAIAATVEITLFGKPPYHPYFSKGTKLLNCEVRTLTQKYAGPEAEQLLKELELML